MPLNDLQRLDVDNALAHFFYGLPSTRSELTPIAAQVRDALAAVHVKPPEQKSEKEEKAPPANPSPFADLAALVSEVEKKIKGLEKRNVQPVTLREVQEHILFYCISRLQYQLTAPADGDDFDLRTWLLNQSIPAAGLDAPWTIPAWLNRLEAHTAMATLGWNTNNTLAALNTLAERHFTSDILTIDYHDYEDYWALPECKERTYETRIIPRDQKIELFEMTRFDALLDLEIRVRLAPGNIKTTVLPDFQPYPVSPPLPQKTLELIEDNLNQAHFATPDLRRKARNAAIEAAENLYVLRMRETIKRKAAEIAEQEATQIFHQHFAVKPPTAPQPVLQTNKHTGTRTVIAPPAPSQRIRSLGVLRTRNRALNRETKLPPQPPAMLPPPVAQVATDDKREAPAVNTVPAPRTDSSLLVAVDQLLQNVPPPRQDDDSPFSRELDDALSHLPGNTLSVPIVRPRTVFASIDKPARVSPPPGFQLLTYGFYLDAFNAKTLTLTELENYTAEETRNLVSSGIRYLLEKQVIKKDMALKIKPGLRQLLETPFYRQYFETLPHEMTLAQAVTPSQASDLAMPYITRLITRHHITLQQALKYSADEMAIIRHPVYGNYFCEHPEMLGLIRGVNADIRHFMLNETVTRLFQEDKLHLAQIRVLKNRLEPHHQETLLDPACRELFLQGKITPTGLAIMTPAACNNVREPAIVNLILQNIITIDMAKRLTLAERGYFVMPQIQTLLLAKKVTPAQVSRFTPVLAQVVTNDTYTAALAETPEFIADLQAWDEASLHSLLHPHILQLFADHIITLTHFKNRTPLFFPTLLSDRVFTLIMEGHIKLRQALTLTPLTLSVIHSENDLFDLLHTATDNEGQADYLPLKIWSQLLSRRLVAIYHDKPERRPSDYHHDSVALITPELELIAAGENLSANKLRQASVALWLKAVRDDLKQVLKGVPRHLIPPYLTQFVHDVDRLCRGDSTASWVETLHQLVTQAETTLDNTCDTPRLIRYQQDTRPVANLSQFHPPAKVTPQGLTRFCQHVVEMGTLDTVKYNLSAPPSPVSPPLLSII